MNYFFVDFETFSLGDLKEIGLDNYAKNKSTGVSMLAHARNIEDLDIWLPHVTRKLPAAVIRAIKDPDTLLIAWNVPFEQAIFLHVLGIDIPTSKFRDPIVLAHSLSLPGKLESVASILKMAELKDERGDELKKMFCLPVSKGGEETLFGISPPLFRDHASHPREFAEYIEYCKQDVRAMRDLWYRMSRVPFPEHEWRGWFLNAKINKFGMPSRRDLAEKGLRIADRYILEQTNRLKEKTGLANPNSDTQMKGWLSTRGYPLTSLRKDFVQGELDNPNSPITPEAREALVLRRESRRTSYSKLTKFLDKLSSDDRFRYQFRYMGAPRTGRWAAGSEIRRGRK